MSPFASKYEALRHGVPSFPHFQYDSNQEIQAQSSTSSNLEQSCSRKSSLSLADSTVDHNHRHHYVRERHLEDKGNMATYYIYKKDGTVTSSHMNPKAHVFTRGMQHPASYEKRGDIVGAHLARRQMLYPALALQEAYLHQDLQYQQSSQPVYSGAVSEPKERNHWSGDEHESSGYPDSSHADSISIMDHARRSSLPDPVLLYPDPDEIRHMHTLHSLLPLLQPERKLNALNGATVDIIEQDTGVMLGYQVPKKLLVLLLGRKVVNKYIRTVHREDDTNWSGPPTVQVIALPRGMSSKSAIRVLMAWMMKACRYSTMNTMEQIRVPKKTFVACSLAQTMELFGLYRDALRFDNCIAQTHFVRRIFATELEALWNCLGEESRYVYAAIKAVGKRLQEHEKQNSEVTPGIDDDMYAMIKEYPLLEARLRDLDLNEQYSPSFSTDWTKKLGGDNHASTVDCESTPHDSKTEPKP